MTASDCMVNHDECIAHVVLQSFSDDGTNSADGSDCGNAASEGRCNSTGACKWKPALPMDRHSVDNPACIVLCSDRMDGSYECLYPFTSEQGEFDFAVSADGEEFVPIRTLIDPTTGVESTAPTCKCLRHFPSRFVSSAGFLRAFAEQISPLQTRPCQLSWHRFSAPRRTRSQRQMARHACARRSSIGGSLATVSFRASGVTAGNSRRVKATVVRRAPTASILAMASAARCASLVTSLTSERQQTAARR